MNFSAAILKAVRESQTSPNIGQLKVLSKGNEMAKSGTTWQPGKSGNPRGRPVRGNTITDLLEERLDKQRFVDILVTMALGQRVGSQEIDLGIRLAAMRLILSYM